jgi:plastocyanin
MAYQGINTGTTPNDGTGDTLVDGGVKINSNFTELYSLIGDGSTLAVGIVTIITAGTNVSINTSTGNVTVSAPTPVSIATTDVDISRNLKSAGITTLGVTTVTSFLTAGITTLASQGGVTTTGGDFYVGGDLYVLDDVVYDEVTGRNINITGVGTIGNLVVGSGVAAGTLLIAGVSTLTGNVSLGGSIFLGEDKAVDFKQGKFRIYHDDSTGNNIDVSSGSFNINADTQIFNSGAGTTQVIATNADGNFGTELYYNNTKRLETKHGGAGVLGYFRVTGISTLGIVTGATYYGDGSNLTGIAVTANVSTNTLVVSGVSTLGVVTGATYYGSGANLTLTGADGSGLTGVVTTLTGADGSGLTGVVTTLTGADGSGLTGVVTTLTGANGGGLTGITTLISAGSNITVTTNAGITTISSTAVGVGTTANVSTNTLVVSGVSTLGVVTGATYYGNASNITNSKWTLGADGSSHYQFTGPGGLSATADPVIYLARGQNYEFVNNMGAHPFEIRSSNGGSAFSTGVTNNAVSNGTLRFEVPFSAPNSLYYQCTSHAGMGGTIVIYPNLFTV